MTKYWKEEHPCRICGKVVRVPPGGRDEKGWRHDECAMNETKEGAVDMTTVQLESLIFDLIMNHPQFSDVKDLHIAAREIAEDMGDVYEEKS